MYKLFCQYVHTLYLGLKYLQDHIVVLSTLVTHLCQEAVCFYIMLQKVHDYYKFAYQCLQMDEDIPYNTAPPLTVCCPFTLHEFGFIMNLLPL